MSRSVKNSCRALSSGLHARKLVACTSASRVWNASRRSSVVSGPSICASKTLGWKGQAQVALWWTSTLGRQPLLQTTTLSIPCTPGLHLRFSPSWVPTEWPRTSEPGGNCVRLTQPWLGTGCLVRMGWTFAADRCAAVWGTVNWWSTMAALTAYL